MNGPWPIGTRVRMKPEWREKMLQLEQMREHIIEFGYATGYAGELINYGDSKGPEQKVRWERHNLTYAYHPDTLEEVE